MGEAKLAEYHMDIYSSWRLYVYGGELDYNDWLFYYCFGDVIE